MFWMCPRGESLQNLVLLSSPHPWLVETSLGLSMVPCSRTPATMILFNTYKVRIFKKIVLLNGWIYIVLFA